MRKKQIDKVEDKLSPELIITLVHRALPREVAWIDVQNVNHLQFSWRGKNFRIDVRTLFVEEYDRNLLTASSEACLIEALLKKQWKLGDRS